MSEWRSFDCAGVSEADLADIEQHIAGVRDIGPETYTLPPGFQGWTCFHCGSTFKTYRGGRLHFGDGDEQPPPLCRYGKEDGDAELRRRTRALWDEVQS